MQYQNFKDHSGSGSVPAPPFSMARALWVFFAFLAIFTNQGCGSPEEKADADTTVAAADTTAAPADDDHSDHDHDDGAGYGYI